MRPTTEESITVNLPEWVSPYTFEKQQFTNEYRATPKPIYIRTYPARPTRPPVRSETTDWNRPTAVPVVTRSLYRPWNPATISTKLLTRYPIRTTRKPTWKPYRKPTTTKPYRKPTRTPTTPRTTREETTTTTVQEKTLRIQPGTILMMDAQYLKEKYMTPGLATTYHRALLADYFGLSEREMKEMGMTVVAWGFSYQVKDKKTNSRGRAPKYFCDFKFRSSTFNAGYVGAHINMDNSAELNG